MKAHRGHPWYVWGEVEYLCLSPPPAHGSALSLSCLEARGQGNLGINPLSTLE